MRDIVAALDAAGVDSVEVAHGDGLNGSSVNYGFARHSDVELIEAAAEVAAILPSQHCSCPGIGTISRSQAGSIRGGRAIVRVATHCTEADVSAQHIATARELAWTPSAS